MIRSAAALICPLLLAGCSLFGVRSGYEGPDYRVVARLGEDAEVRQYPERLAVEAVVEAADEEEGRSAAFRLLFDYISGANRQAAKIEMTVPVEVEEGGQAIAMTLPVETAEPVPGQVRMRFFLPAAYSLESAPQPTDPRLAVIALPEAQLAVLRFSGFGGEERVAAKRRQLLAALEGSGWTAEGEPVAFFYDPPWTLPFLRRNEVAVAVGR